MIGVIQLVPAAHQHCHQPPPCLSTLLPSAAAQVYQNGTGLESESGVANGGFGPLGRRFKVAVRFGRVPKREKARILAAMQQSTQNRGNQRALASELDDQPRLLASVLQAHVETCEFTREKVSAMRQRARDCPNYSMPTLTIERTRRKSFLN
uniref:Uncharacterized protein n=1 Tax=Anopheles atroparvus TaxID=41427 RepID=A0A182J4T5_ANOAO